MKTITIHLPDDAPMGGDIVIHGTPGFPLAPTPPDPAEASDDTTLRHDTPLETVIAATCHEANRQYCRMIGDASQLPWSQAPGWQQASALEGVRGIMSGAITKPEQSHESWMAHKLDGGWVYGPEKSEVAKTHPCLVPYAALPANQRKKDRLFFAIATALLAVE